MDEEKDILSEEDVSEPETDLVREKSVKRIINVEGKEPEPETGPETETETAGQKPSYDDGRKEPRTAVKELGYGDAKPRRIITRAKTIHDAD